jgi:choline dehydrogenase
MGPSSDPDAVVDASLHVRGVEGLRVADASIMPDVVDAPTHAAAVMIGEKCAALMLRDRESDLTRRR